MTAVPLSAAERTALAARLRERLAELRRDVATQLAGSDDPNVVGLRNRLEDTDDWAVADALSELDIAHLTRDLRELSEVQMALARLRDDSYGACIDCGAPIPFARLTANPSALRCVHCQEAQERRAGGVG